MGSSRDPVELAVNSPAPETLNGRVVVAMSGGVDSSVAAAILHAEGADVVGIAMRLYASPEGDTRSCCSPDDLYDARRVAESLGFPFYVANYQKAFQQRVVDYFVEEYRRGRTPSPCVACNDHLKFDILLQRMRALEGSALVTGHYARIERVGDRYALLRGVDAQKDQSYFLFGLRRELLAHIRFPLGGLTKGDVRERARALGLSTADKPESQDLCFVGRGDYASFVAAADGAAPTPGRIVHAGTGAVLGTHDGVHRFTVGQRRGLGIASSEPLYVQSIDADSGDVLVSGRDALAVRRVVIERCNWLRWDDPPASFRCEAQVRYRQQARPAEVEVGHDRAVVTFDEPQYGVSPGQAAVVYDGDEVLGGGWIERTESA